MFPGNGPPILMPLMLIAMVCPSMAWATTAPRAIENAYEKVDRTPPPKTADPITISLAASPGTSEPCAGQRSHG